MSSYTIFYEPGPGFQDQLNLLSVLNARARFGMHFVDGQKLILESNHAQA